jgi:DNA polymerase III delta prime subunit
MFKPATREKTKARVLLAGPSGSGKTRAALEIAHTLGPKVAVIDTENRSASLYVGLNGLKFDVCELQPPYTYEKYLQAMRSAFAAKYDVLVVDSLTHAWAGEGGALEQVDRASGKGGNSFTAWKDVTPEHNRLLSAMSASPIHLLCTVRTKTAYVMEERENRAGKIVQVPRKVGLAPIFRAEVEYEFSVQLEINLDHEVTVTKTRVTELDGARFAPGELGKIGETLRMFHETGTVPSNVSPLRPAQREEPNAPTVERFATYWFKGNKHTGEPVGELSDESLGNYIARLEKCIAAGGEWGPKAVPYLEAATRDLERRLAQEGPADEPEPEPEPALDEPPAAYNPETGEVLAHPPADDDLAEKLEKSVELAKAGLLYGDTSEGWGLTGADAPSNQSNAKRSRKGAA